MLNFARKEFITGVIFSFSVWYRELWLFPYKICFDLMQNSYEMQSVEIVFNGKII